MTDPNPYTAAELDDIQRSAERQRSWASVVGPKTLLRLVAQARRAIELESLLRNLIARIDRDGGHAQEGETPSESAARAEKLAVDRGVRIAELETQLAEREGLERRLLVWLKSSTLAEAAVSIDGAGCYSARLERGVEHPKFFGENADYWQALRAALEAADAEKASGK